MKVLCLNRNDLPNEVGIIHIEELPSNHYWFDRTIVDGKEPKYFDVGKQFPQLLPYIIVKCGDKYLSYYRKGKEDRLLGKRSIGFGGHIEPDDIENYLDIVKPACRELQEELGLSIKPVNLNKLIISKYDNVSRVHVGLLMMIELDNPDMIKPDKNEIINPEWLSIDSIRANLDQFESWSRLVAKYLDK